MRRRAGVGAIQKHKIQQDKFKEKGLEMQENQLEQMTGQMEKFKLNLEDFAAKHKNEIKKNGKFRRQFQEMCAAIGVDPLASGKGFWSEVLGVGDFYYELGVQLVDISLATSHLNGGVLPLQEALNTLNKNRKQENHVNEDDIIRAIKKLDALGSGMEVVGTSAKFIFTIPGEFSMDHTLLLQELEMASKLTVEMASNQLNWKNERSLRGLSHLQTTGIVWVDEQDLSFSYWLPSAFQRS